MLMAVFCLGASFIGINAQEKASASQSKRLFYYVVLVRNANVAVRGYRFLRNSIRN